MEVKAELSPASRWEGMGTETRDTDGQARKGCWPWAGCYGNEGAWCVALNAAEDPFPRVLPSRRPSDCWMLATGVRGALVGPSAHRGLPSPLPPPSGAGVDEVPDPSRRVLMSSV